MCFYSSKLVFMLHFGSSKLIESRQLNGEAVVGIPHSLLSLSFFPADTRSRTSFFAKKISQTQLGSARFGGIWA